MNLHDEIMRLQLGRTAEEFGNEHLTAYKIGHRDARHAAAELAAAQEADALLVPRELLKNFIEYSVVHKHGNVELWEEHKEELRTLLGKDGEA